ncbi:hypothetical protein B296_00051870 [Ensete ventricosum]|uniref:Uncharacterized protein n=1 Tax=Ensete ventricosum TaxID=4639 RepID=A0A426YF18_ENSVE|nr:hypothetical protein B296_00051870 [Ensete ventricosum]
MRAAAMAAAGRGEEAQEEDDGSVVAGDGVGNPRRWNAAGKGRKGLRDASSGWKRSDRPLIYRSSSDLHSVVAGEDSDSGWRRLLLLLRLFFASSIAEQIAEVIATRGRSGRHSVGREHREKCLLFYCCCLLVEEAAIEKALLGL